MSQPVIPLTRRQWRCLARAIASVEAISALALADGKESALDAIDKDHSEIRPIFDRVRGNRSAYSAPTWADVRLILAATLRHFLNKLEES